MAAIYTYHDSGVSGSELFKAGINVINSVKVEFLEDLLAPGSLCVITDLGVQTSETVQFFMTFDDLISWFYFGKGLGALTVRGLLFTCTSGTPGLPILLNQVMRKARGKAVRVSVGSAVFSCVLTNMNLSLTQDPSPTVEFTLSLSIVEHNLPGREREVVPCEYNPRFDDIDING